MVAQGIGEKGVRATAKGNLPLSVCKPIRVAFSNPLRPKFNDSIRTETDFFELHVARLIFELSGLIKKQKGRFSLTQKGQKLMAPEKSGELFKVLIDTYLDKFNWSYVDGYDDLNIVRWSAFFMMYALYLEGDEWVNLESYEEIFLKAFPSSLDEVSAYDYEYAESQVRNCLGNRMIRWFFYLFGFIEVEEINDDETKLFGSNYRIKKTPALSQYIKFGTSIA